MKQSSGNLLRWLCLLGLVGRSAVAFTTNTDVSLFQKQRRVPPRTTPLKVVASPPPQAEKGKEDQKLPRIQTIRNVLQRKRGSSGGSGCDSSSAKPIRIHTIEEYKAEVADEKEKLVVVRFYSPVCKSCQAAEKYFRQLCREYHPNVKFVELPTTKENEYLHKGLGVQSFPFAHIYHPEAGLVEELKINKHVFGEFKRVFQYYIDGQGEVEYPEEGICEPAGCRID